MKKFLFILVVLAGSGILVLLSFSKDVGNKKSDIIDVDLTENVKLSVWDVNKKVFTETSLTGAKRGSDTIYFHQLSPIDGIYYRSGDKKPLSFEKKGGTNIVTFGSGLYVCTIQTGLEKYEFHLNDLTVIPKGRGTFLADTTSGKIKIFSFDAFLDTGLVNGAKRDRVASFMLFPSLLFNHDPANTMELKEADILRISTIDSIRYVDMKTPGDIKMVFSGENETKDLLFFTETQKDIINRIRGFENLYTSILDPNNTKIANTSFFSESSSLLINGSKKEILLKNTLIQDILRLIRNTNKLKEKGLVDAMKSTISEMNNLGPGVYSDGLSMLRQYYYITTFSHFSDKDNLFDFSSQDSPILLETEKIITKSTGLRQGEYYTHISDLFSVYYFLNLESQDFNNFFEKILQKILDNKVLTKNEFLPFSFFVTQYLSTGPVIPNEDTILTVFHLFQITNDYYSNNKSDETKLATITSTTYYNYTKIFAKMYTVFLTNFIDKTPEGLLLKKDEKGNAITFEQSFVDTFTKVISMAKTDMESKKATLYSKGSFQSDSRVIDSYTLLNNTLKSFDIFISMFNNYGQYLVDFNLNDSNRSARGILVNKGNEMSMEILQTYLKKFNNLDLQTLKVKNNFEKDGFYETEVVILGNTFHFKLWQQSHILTDISYTDAFGKVHTFPNITISLDQKESQLKDLFTSVSDASLQYKYDFRNFFEITFSKENSSLSSVTIDPKETTQVKNTGSDTPEIRLFIQKELLDKDFKNIADFLPIGFSNINASIGEGSYLIDLNNIQKVFIGAINKTYTTEIYGKYLFNRHTFSRLAMKVKEEGDTGLYQFNDTAIEILPARISLLSLPDILKDLGLYLDTIKESYSHQKSIIIDLTGKKVLLDNVPFTPNFPTK